MKIFIFFSSFQPEPIDAPSVCTATFSPRVSVRDGTKQLWEVKAGPPVAWANRLRRWQRRASETHTYPTPARQSAEIVLRRAVSVRKAARRKGSLGAFVKSFHLPWENTGYVSGANQSHEVGNSDAARRLGILTVPLLQVRARRSSLAASVRTCSSPTRPAWPL